MAHIALNFGFVLGVMLAMFFSVVTYFVLTDILDYFFDRYIDPR